MTTTPYLHLRSDIAHKRVTPGNLAEGQIALNINEDSPGLFFKDTNSDVIKVGPAHVGELSPNSSVPSGGHLKLTKGEMWLDTSTPGDYKLKVYTGSGWLHIGWNSLRTINGALTAQLKVVNNTSSTLPDVCFDDDTDTGIYSPGPDRFGIATNGLSRLIVSDDGTIYINGTNDTNAAIRLTASGSVYLDQELNVGAGVVLDSAGHSGYRVTSDGVIYTQATSSHAGDEERIVVLHGADQTVSIKNNGDGTFAGAIVGSKISISDEKFKKNITDAGPQLKDCLGLAQNLQNWDWKENAPISDAFKKRRFLGITANNAEKVCPQITYTVSRNLQGDLITPEKIIPAIHDENGNIITEEQIIPATYEKIKEEYKTINHDIILYKQLGAIAELNTKVEDQKAEIETLKATVEQLVADVAALKGE